MTIYVHYSNSELNPKIILKLFTASNIRCSLNHGNQVLIHSHFILPFRLVLATPELFKAMAMSCATITQGCHGHGKVMEFLEF